MRLTAVIAERNPVVVENEPFYALQAVDISGREIRFRSYETLPPDDAVGLLTGNDQTGLIPWLGTLMLLRWIFEQKFLLHSLAKMTSSEADPHPGAPTASSSVHWTVVELGSGCGVGALGVAREIRTLLGSPIHSNVSVRVVATDGNPDCVALSRRNLLEQIPRSTTQQPVNTDAVTFRWGDLVPPAILRGADVSLASEADEAHHRRRVVTLLAGDVLYSADSVAPLFASIDALLAAFMETGSSEEDVVTHASWLLSFVPRALTAEGNRAIAHGLIRELQARQCQQQQENKPIIVAASWAVVSVTPFPIGREPSSWRTCPLAPEDVSPLSDDVGVDEWIAQLTGAITEPNGCVLHVDLSP